MAATGTGNTAVEESELRCVAHDLGSEWETLGTYLGCKSTDIQKLKINRHNQDVSLTIFDMLMSWKYRHPTSEQRKDIVHALGKCDRHDIADHLMAGTYSETSIRTDSTNLNVEQCREDLRWTYLHDVCRLPIYPWDKSHCMSIEDVFANLFIILDLPQPFRSLKVPLSSYEDIFTHKTQEGNIPNRIIVQGEAGTGKSTLSAKFAYDWAKGKDSYLKNIQLLFLLRMRDLEQSDSLEDAVLRHLLPKDTAITSNQLRRFLDLNSEQCCIILDGYDESCYHDLYTMRDSGNITDILSCKTLRRCLVVVTSRPERLDEFDEYMKHYMKYEVMGFSDSEVERYVRIFFSESTDQANGLLEFMDSNSMKIGLAATPLVTHLLCLYWKHVNISDDDGSSGTPTTMTKLLNALFNFMHDHYSAKGTSSSKIDLEHVILQLGMIAVNALWPPFSQLVFTEEEVVQKTSRNILTDACNLGIVSIRSRLCNMQSEPQLVKHSGSLPRSNVRTRTIEKKKVEFFHKLGQEHCAGHFLANISEMHPLQFEELINSVHKSREVLNLSVVLLSASGNSWKCAEGIMRRLNVIYFAEIWKHMNRFTRGRLGAEESRRIKQFIELCIQCNFESEAAGKLNDLLLKLFPWKKVVFTGMTCQTATAFRYFLQHLQNSGAIEHLFVNGVPQKGVDFINDSTFDTLSENLLQKYDQAASVINYMGLKSMLQGLELPSKGDLAKTQLYQVFEKWGVETPSSIYALLDKLDCISLKTLNLRHLRLGEQSQRLFEIIGSGGLSTLTHLDLANTGLDNTNFFELAAVIHTLQHLQTLILFSNKADEALVEFSESLTSLSLRWLDISLMGTSAESMKAVCYTIPRFGNRLDALYLDGNDIHDDSLEILTTALPRISCLQRLSISVSMISNSSFLEHFLKSLKSVTHLEALQLSVPSKWLSMFILLVSRIMNTWRKLQDLQLGCTETDMNLEEISTSACEHFLAALDDVKQLQWLDLVNIRLPASCFDALVNICRRHKYQRLQ